MRILCVRLSAMGDVVQSLGAVQALANARPDAELWLAVQREFAPLLDGAGFGVSVVPHDRRGGPLAYWRTGRASRRRRPDVALDLQGTWKSAGIAWLSGAPLRVGAGASVRREPASRALLNRFARGVGSRHPADLALDIVREVAADAVATAPRLRASDAEVERETAALRAAGIEPTAPFRVFVVGAPADPRTWPIEWMAREAAAAGPPALWLRGPAEGSVALPDGAAAILHRPGELRRLVALGALVARAGGVVLGPDRGACHVLAACGARTRVLFGPQDPAATAPPAAEVLVRRDGPECVPCRRRACRHPLGPVCMAFTTESARAVSPVR
jgi:heptosyltransferase-1